MDCKHLMSKTMNVNYTSENNATNTALNIYILTLCDCVAAQVTGTLAGPYWATSRAAAGRWWGSPASGWTAPGRTSPEYTLGSTSTCHGLDSICDCNFLNSTYVIIYSFAFILWSKISILRNVRSLFDQRDYPTILPPSVPRPSVIRHSVLCSSSRQQHLSWLLKIRRKQYGYLQNFHFEFMFSVSILAGFQKYRKKVKDRIILFMN